MTRTQIQQLVVILLLIVFGFVWMNTRKGSTPVPATLSPPAPGPAERAAPSRPRPPEAEEGPAGEVSLTRDLFQLPALLIRKIRDREKALEASLEAPPEPAAQVEEPVSVSSADLSAFDLQGIFWGTDRPQAIINRKILSVGDTIEGAKISAISKEGVTLDYRGQTVELKRKADIRPRPREDTGHARWGL